MSDTQKHSNSDLNSRLAANAFGVWREGPKRTMELLAELERVTVALREEATMHHSLRWSLGLDTHPDEEPQSREDSHRNLDALLALAGGARAAQEGDV
jgi:hypothetical protein